MVCCRCDVSGCRGGNCKCSQIGCTIFCVCEGGPLCMNPLTRKFDVDEKDHDENLDDDDVEGAEGSVDNAED